jgi:hypothetical protein
MRASRAATSSASVPLPPADLDAYTMRASPALPADLSHSGCCSSRCAGFDSPAPPPFFDAAAADDNEDFPPFFSEEEEEEEEEEEPP